MPNYVELERGFLEKLAEAAHEVFCGGLKAKGYRSGPVTRDEQKKHSSLRPYAELPEDEIEGLARMEHERWKREKLNGGWRYTPTTDKSRMLHRDILPWDRLSPDDKDKDRALPGGIPRIMAKAGYTIAEDMPSQVGGKFNRLRKENWSG